MNAVEFDFGTKRERAIPASAAGASCEAGLFCWVDVDQAADPEGARAVLEEMGVNELAAAEALGPDADGRHDVYDDCLHVAVTSASVRDGKLVPTHVDILIGERYLVSLRRGPVEFIEQVRRHYRQDFVRFARTPSFLLYEYWDHLIGGYKRAFQSLEGAVERVQARIFGTVDDAIFNDVAAATHDLLNLRKIMLGSREVLHEITTRRTPFVSEHAIPSLERMAGTLERLGADVTTEREALAETLNLYMGMVSHRTNRVVSRLTVVSMVFLPLTFLVGIYGMNFKAIPELEWEHGYVAFWAAIVTIASGLLVYMKRRKWW